MQDNISHLRKISSDQQKTVLQHPHGHQITIAHAHLSPEHKAKLDAMPHYAEGGVVDPMQAPDMLQPVNPLAPDAPVVPQATDALDTSFDARRPTTMGEFKSPNQQLDDNEAKYKEMSGDSKTLEPSSTPDSGTFDPYAAAAPKNGMLPGPQVTDTQNTQDLMSGALNAVAGGINAEATAQGQLGAQNADIYKQQELKIQDLQKDFEHNSAAINQEISHTMEDIKNGHIDPKHYINSMTDTGKVSTAIGMLLSGLGSGLTGQPNMAQEFLNKQIDRDIDAQKMDMQKKENLLSANFKQLGNMRDATLMTKAMYSEIYANKLAEAAAKSANPMAKARAQQAIGELKLKYGPEIQQLAQRQTVMQGVQKGTVPPEKAVPILVPKEHQKDVFKAIDDNKYVREQGDKIMKAYDSAVSENTIAGRAAHGGATPAGVTTFLNLMTPLLHDKEGKINVQEMEQMKDYLGGPGSGSSKDTELRQGVIDYMMSKAHDSTPEAFGITLPKPIFGAKKTKLGK